MKHFFKILGLLLGLLIMHACRKQSESNQAPNIVLIITDDQTYQAVSAFGHTAVQTPHLDKLVATGATFTQAFNMGGWNGAICTASRSMLISGRSLWRTNKFRQHWREGEALDQTWGRMLEAKGYATYMTGKWHVDAPADSVFQHVRNVRPGMPPDAWAGAGMGQRFQDLAAGKYHDLTEIMPVGYHRPMSESDQSWSPTDTSFGGFWSGGQHWSEVVADDALGFIKNTKGADQPFFMYLAFNAPHDPRQAPAEYLDRFPIDEIELPENWSAEHPLKDSMGCGAWLRDEALAPFPRTTYAIKKHLQEYYAIIAHLDDQIGRILDALDQVDGETYVFFTADHGLAVGQHGLLGKQNMYDHSLRVPLVMRGPGIEPGSSYTQTVYYQDIMPTTLELAGIAVPDYVEFKSLLPLVEKRRQEQYEAIYGAYIDWQRMIRKDGYKLIVYPRAGATELYDLNKDPLEMHDLSEDPGQQDRKQALMADLQELMLHYDDDLSLPASVLDQWR